VGTGIANLDAIIGLELAGDGRALADRLEMRREPCSFHPVLGYPPLCGENEAEGQLVEVFPEGNCEGFDQRADKAREEVAAVHPKTELYAVLAPSAPRGGTEIGYELVFNSAPPAAAGGFTYVVRGDRIVSRFGACNGVGANENGRDRLLPLANTGIAADRSTKIAPLDQIIAATEGGGGDQLINRLSYQSSGCSQRYSPGDGLYCLPGEAEGSAIHVFSADGCVGRLLRSSEAEALVTDAVDDAGSPPARLYAIGLPSLVDSQAFNYRLFFARGDGADARGFELDILDGRIARFDSGCGPIARRATNVMTFLVSPTVPPSRSAADAASTIGLADLDEIVQLVSSGDVPAVVRRTKTTVVPCGSPGDGFGTVPCGGEARGTPIESIVTGSCALTYESVADAIAFHIIPQGLRLYSATRMTQPSDSEYFRRFAPAYSLVFSMPSSPPSAGLDFVSVHVGGGQIVAIGAGCGGGGTSSDSALGPMLRPPDQR
jgi:hypothetical protein